MNLIFQPVYSSVDIQQGILHDDVLFQVETIPINLQELDIRDSGLPIPRNKWEIISPEKSKVRFTPTSKYDDVSQTLVPMFDTRKISQKPKLPLAGLGSFLAKEKGSGGVIALRLISFDQSSIYQQRTDFPAVPFVS